MKEYGNRAWRGHLYDRDFQLTGSASSLVAAVRPEAGRIRASERASSRKLAVAQGANQLAH